MTLNVCGLKTKLLCPEFTDYLNEFDIISCEETKLDNLDEIHLDQHQCFQKNRKQKTKSKSGGIAVFIRNDLCKHFTTTIETDCEYVLWFKMSKSLFNADEDVVFGAVYIPPASSSYNVNDILEEFYFELDENARLYKNLIIMGDLNARIATLPDITETDSDFYSHIDVDPDEVFSIDCIFELKKCNFDVKRMSQDRISNKCGRNLIECCKYNDLLILNGRAFLDRNIGRTTCKNSSVVDYVICSLSFLKYLTYFEIKDFCELYSDAHAPIEFSLRRMLPSNNKEYISIAENKIKPWDESKSSEFVQNIDRSKIEELNENLLNMDSFNRDEINDIMSRIGSIFTSSAEKTFGRYRARVNTSYRNEKK